MSEEAKREHRNEYLREYRKRPKAQETARRYRQRPDVQERERKRKRAADVLRTDRATRQSPGAWAAYRIRLLARKYSIDDGFWARMWQKQGGLCAICRRGAAECADHDHRTGRLRALLCQRCNKGLGVFNDDPAQLRAAADYIEAHAATIPLAVQLEFHG